MVLVWAWSISRDSILVKPASVLPRGVTLFAFTVKFTAKHSENEMAKEINANAICLIVNCSECSNYSQITSVITEPELAIFHFLNHAQVRLRVHHIVMSRGLQLLFRSFFAVGIGFHNSI